MLGFKVDIGKLYFYVLAVNYWNIYNNIKKHRIVVVLSVAV